VNAGFGEADMIDLDLRSTTVVDAIFSVRAREREGLITCSRVSASSERVDETGSR
jgi:hypothetical protein